MKPTTGSTGISIAEPMQGELRDGTLSGVRHRAREPSMPRMYLSCLGCVILVATAVVSEEGATPDKRLRELVEFAGEKYFQARDRLLAEPKALESIRRVVPADHGISMMREIVLGWTDSAEECRRFLTALDRVQDVFETGAILHRPGTQPDPSEASRCMGEHAMAEGQRTVPVALELLWKGDLRRNRDEWRWVAALQVLGYYGGARHARFCLDLIPALPTADLVDVAVDTALTLGQQDALKELEERAHKADMPKIYSDAIIRLQRRQEDLRKRLVIALREARKLEEDPFRELADSRTIGILATLPPLESWQMQWAARIVLARWEYTSPYRRNLCGSFWNDARIVEREYVGPLPERQRALVLNRYRSVEFRPIATFLCRYLWLWVDVLDESRKLVLAEVLTEHADSSVVPPLIAALSEEKSEAVATLLRQMIEKHGDQDAVRQIQNLIEKKPETKARLQATLDALLKRLGSR